MPNHDSEEADLLAEVSGPVERFLARVAPDPSLIEDIRSDTLLAVLREVRKRRVLRKPVSFALRVAWNKTVDATRGARPSAPLTAGTPAACPDRAREVREWLLQAWARLDADDRALLHLRFEEELSYKEAAAVMGIPVGTVAWRIHRARKRLRRQLEQLGGDERILVSALALMPWLREGAPLSPFTPPVSTIVPRALRLGRWAYLTLGLMLAVAVIVGLELIRGGSPTAGLTREGPKAPAQVAHDTKTTAASVLTQSYKKSAEAPTATRIRGRVLDTEDRPVPGARILLRPFASRSGPAIGIKPHPGCKVAVTDDDGAFDISVDQGRTVFDLHVHADNLEPALVEWVAPGAEITIRLRSGYAMRGTVKDLNGNPIPGARVSYLTVVGDAIARLNCVTDSGGRFMLRGLPSGEEVGALRSAGVLEIVADGFAPQVLVTQRTWLSRAQHAGPDVPVYLSRGAEITGVVRERGSGFPVRGAQIELWSLEVYRAGPRLGRMHRPLLEPRILGTTTSDDRGGFRLGSVPVEEAGVVLLGRSESVAALALTVRAPGFAPRMVDVTTRSGRTSAQVPITVRPSGGLAGRVIRPDGSPFPGVRVSVNSTETRWPTHDAKPWVTRTDAEGRFSLDGVPASATVTLHARARFVGDKRRGVTVEQGQIRELRDIVLNDPPPPAPVRGVVVDGTDRPVANARVFWDPPRARWATVSGPDGRFSLASGIIPNRGSVTHPIVAQHGHAEGRVTVTVPGAPSSVRIRLARASDAADAEPDSTQRGIMAEARGELTVRLRNAATGLLFTRSAHARLYRSDELVASSLRYGPGRIWFAGVEPGQYMLAVVADGRGEVRRPVTVSASANPTITVDLEPAAMVRGRIFATDGSPLPRRGTVSAWPAGPGVPRHVPVTAEGTFTLNGLHPGRWEIDARLATNVRQLASPEPVSVDVRGDGQPVDIDLPVVPAVWFHVSLRIGVPRGAVSAVSRQPEASVAQRFRIILRDPDTGAIWHGIPNASSDPSVLNYAILAPQGPYRLEVQRGIVALTREVKLPGNAVLDSAALDRKEKEQR